MSFYGDQIRWFVGDVTSISDPLQMGRVRVRVTGVHQNNEQEIPSDNLPWAQTVVPVTQGGTNGLGNILGIHFFTRSSKSSEGLIRIARASSSCSA